MMAKQTQRDTDRADFEATLNVLKKFQKRWDWLLEKFPDFQKAISRSIKGIEVLVEVIDARDWWGH